MPMRPHRHPTHSQDSQHSEVYPEGYYEDWNLFLKDPKTQDSLWLAFRLLRSDNGFQQTAHVSVVLQTKKGSEVLQEDYPLEKFSYNSDKDLIEIQGSSLGLSGSEGRIQRKGKSLSWSLKFSAKPQQFNLIPKPLAKLSPCQWEAPAVALTATGSFTLGTKKRELKAWTGSMDHQSGSRRPQSAVTCTTAGEVPFVGTKIKLGALWPCITTMHAQFKDTTLNWNTLLDSLRIRSQSTLLEWNFYGDRGRLRLKGHVQGHLNETVCIRVADTNETACYLSYSGVAEMALFLYEGGRIVQRESLERGGHFLAMSRQPNPYVSVAD